MVLEDLFRRPSALRRFRLPPLGPEMDGFCSWLHPQGFSREILRRRVWQASHFNQCLRRWGVNACPDVQTNHAERFIEQHLPRCRCRGGLGCGRAGAQSTVRSLIEYLCQRGLVVRSLPPAGPYDEVLQPYLDYLTCERHLAPTTLQNHRVHATELLEEIGPPTVPRLNRLSPEQVLSFFTNHTLDKSPSQRRCLQGVVRSFLRFCLHQGYLERDLSQAIPRLRTYQLSDVPRAISEGDAQKTLACIDRATPVGRRDFAIILMLYTYGIRGGQLRALRLQDVQWSQNRLRVPAAKRGKEIVLPLTEEVGESLLEYLCHARPQVPYPEVFLTAQAPLRPLQAPAVSRMVAQRMQKAGVHPPRAGSHVFRHGFATRMLQNGQSLKTIADLLGHRNINTTFRYTKVDLAALHQLPLEWPEVSP